MSLHCEERSDEAISLSVTKYLKAGKLRVTNYELKFEILNKTEIRNKIEARI
ncbi:MAG TPA: hypothetical protein VJ455_03515 [Ignavibacteria bacterium]|nr:hypothetical protein [Ignavibacteria bacterium]